MSGVMDRAVMLVSAMFCFASFIWGMSQHFRRTGKPTRAMMLTALLGTGSAGLQIAALATRRILWIGIALLLYGASAMLFWRAVRVTRGKLAACGQGCVSGEVIQAGPYRYIRHPFYTSYNLAWIAGFIATGWWPLAIAAGAMAWLYERSARQEEQGFLGTAMADEYLRFMRRTGRYLPALNIGLHRYDRSAAQTPGARKDDGTMCTRGTRL